MLTTCSDTVLRSFCPGGIAIWRNVAVPSRLYAKPSKDIPLAGARMRLKDIFPVEGCEGDHDEQTKDRALWS